MKKLTAIICTLLIGASVYAFDPNEKVLRSFNETFANAEDVKWHEYQNYYTVSFLSNGIRSKVNYDKEGNMLGSIRYYQPNLLPLNVLNRIKKSHPKKSLYGVTEVTGIEGVTYYVKLEDAKHWWTLKVDDEGNSEVYEKYKKG